MDERPAASHYELQAQPISRPSNGYAFLNHSSMTLPNNLPPNVDDKLVARHKRRRTSPEDQNILEAAYTRNPKPDKSERLELVKQVALGEKEVQIWFQNRRQTSRRKSRPLLPHEIIQYQLSHSGYALDPVHFDVDSQDDLSGPVSANAQLVNSTILPGLPNSSSNQDSEAARPSNLWRSQEATSDLSEASQDSSPDHLATKSLASSQSLSSHPGPIVESSTSAELSHFPGCLANRKSAPSLHVDQLAFQTQSSGRQHVSREVSRPILKKSASSVHLSLSSEGNAKIVAKDGTSPSPPRIPPASQPSTASVSSQQQAIVTVYSQNAPLFKPLQRSASGRSRDSRAWEFWCDKDARTELEDKAEKDASGSAADAIDLLRSASGRRILGTLPNKRNSFLSRQMAAKRPKLDNNTSLLKRSSTSLGRLQHNTPIVATSASDNPPKLKYSESATSIYIPGNDSDKENWSPSTTEHSEECESRGHALQKEASTRQGENDPEVDPEVAAFMRGNKSTNVSQEEELDCVQNLLSLSQGNWR